MSGGDSSADWRPGGALAQFGLMSGQLEVHQGALCTAPVSPNLRRHRRCPDPQPGHGGAQGKQRLTLWAHIALTVALVQK